MSGATTYFPSDVVIHVLCDTQCLQLFVAVSFGSLCDEQNLESLQMSKCGRPPLPVLLCVILQLNPAGVVGAHGSSL